MNRRLRLRQAARASYERGVRETSHNWGAAIRAILKGVGITRPAPWCAAFVYDCCLRAGFLPSELPARHKAARVLEWKKWAEKHGILYSFDLAQLDSKTPPAPTPGDLALWINRNGTGHIGVVVAGTFGTLLPLAFKTVEGNTNEAGSREGDAVLERVRYLDDCPGPSGWLFIKMSGALYWEL